MLRRITSTLGIGCASGFSDAEEMGFFVLEGFFQQCKESYVVVAEYKCANISYRKNHMSMLFLKCSHVTLKV